MRIILLFLSFLFTTIHSSCSNVADFNDMKKSPSILYLKNPNLELGVVPEIGGAAFFFNRPGEPNILFTYPEKIENWQARIPDPTDLSQIPNFEGHVIWLAPQSDFWNQQEVLPKLHGKVWPPDPYLIFGTFEIVERTAKKLILQGPASPYTGVSLRKSYTLKSDRLELEVVARNETQRVLRWGLWSNTRVDPTRKTWVPVNHPEDVRIDTQFPELISSSVKNGYFTYEIEKNRIEKVVGSKAFIQPKANWIASYKNKCFFIKQPQAIEPATIHTDQAPIEIYYSRANSINDGLMELEAHGAYTILEPGDSMSFKETWMIYETEKNLSENEQIEWLQEYGRNHSLLEGV